MELKPAALATAGAALEEPMEHYHNRPRHRDKHHLRRRDYFNHSRDDGFPGIDLDGATLAEIRERVRGGNLAPFRNDPRRDELGEAIDALDAE